MSGDGVAGWGDDDERETGESKRHDPDTAAAPRTAR